MLDRYLNTIVEVNIRLYAGELKIRGKLTPHSTLSNWYILVVPARNIFFTFEVKDYKQMGETLDGIRKLNITIKDN